MIFKYCYHCGWIINTCFSYYRMPNQNELIFLHEKCYVIMNEKNRSKNEKKKLNIVKEEYKNDLKR